MPELELKIRCQRCGDQMEMKEPAPGQPWRPDQFWVCARCGRHFWSTYANPPVAAAAAATPAVAPAAAPGKP
jgi:DNA-directed RNA polymerase subunit RPC12/RpoP